MRNPVLFETPTEYCPTCHQNTSTVTICPECTTRVSLAEGDFPVCPTCKDRIAPVAVCHQCMTDRDVQEAPKAKRAPAVPLSPGYVRLLQDFTRDCLRHAERAVPIPVSYEPNGMV
jgi:hypothetical protein